MQLDLELGVPISLSLSLPFCVHMDLEEVVIIGVHIGCHRTWR